MVSQDVNTPCIGAKQHKLASVQAVEPCLNADPELQHQPVLLPASAGCERRPPPACALRVRIECLCPSAAPYPQYSLAQPCRTLQLYWLCTNTAAGDCEHILMPTHTPSAYTTPNQEHAQAHTVQDYPMRISKHRCMHAAESAAATNARVYEPLSVNPLLVVVQVCSCNTTALPLLPTARLYSQANLSDQKAAAQVCPNQPQKVCKSNCMQARNASSDQVAHGAGLAGWH